MTGRRRTQHLLQAVAAALLAIVLSSSLLASAAITYPSACSSDCSALGASLLGTSCTLANPVRSTYRISISPRQAPSVRCRVDWRHMRTTQKGAIRFPIPPSHPDRPSPLFPPPISPSHSLSPT
ncbi:hypothetical protein DFJ73DRAFT_858799 [Zopfochytrium polystomum]|nr:hypothetical protein DFJ73DRAFT_858799 [Zopfochytrium polystomum]